MSRSQVLSREALLTALGVLMLLVFLFPIYWMIVTSVRPQTGIFAYPPQIIPLNLDFGAWTGRIFNDPTIIRYFLNSAVIGTGTALLTLALSAPAAYGLTHLRIRGKSVVLLIALSSLMFPVIMLATPLFVVFNRFNLLDSYGGLIIANTTVALPFALIVLRPFFLSIPSQLADAALIDGCTLWGAFLRIVLPLAAPGLFTVATFSFLFGWNDLVFALTMTSSEEMRPVTAGLWNFIGANVTKWPAVMAFSTLAMLPPLMVFLVAQRYVVSGLTSGAVKE